MWVCRAFNLLLLQPVMAGKAQALLITLKLTAVHLSQLVSASCYCPYWVTWMAYWETWWNWEIVNKIGFPAMTSQLDCWEKKCLIFLSITQTHQNKFVCASGIKYDCGQKLGLIKRKSSFLTPFQTQVWLITSLIKDILFTCASLRALVLRML